MAFYADEGEIWKCAQHPSKRRRTGVCPACLKQRLSALCPDCANVRPCSCYATTSSSSSSLSSSSSIHLSDINRASNPIDGEPALRRSRSYAFPFFRSARFTAVDYKNSPEKLAGKSSFWSVSWWQKKAIPREKIEAEMKRSRSVSAAVTESKIKSSKTGKGWHFPSPMKVFRQSYGKNPKFVHERSPLHRG